MWAEQNEKTKKKSNSESVTIHEHVNACSVYCMYLCMYSCICVYICVYVLATAHSIMRSNSVPLSTTFDWIPHLCWQRRVQAKLSYCALNDEKATKKLYIITKTKNAHTLALTTYYSHKLNNLFKCKCLAQQHVTHTDTHTYMLPCFVCPASQAVNVAYTHRCPLARILLK